MRALVIGGTQSGVGKTSITLGLIAAYRRRGLRVQPFKVGPDFIDPGHHRRAAGRVSRNLDGWMLSRQCNQQIFARHAADADLAIVEGVMGLFDGREGRTEVGSTAEMAKWIGAPVLLVVDAWALSRSAAAVVLGFSRFDPGLRIAGVVFNRVGGDAHLRWLREAVESTCAVPVLGGIPNVPEVTIPERHLGLLMSGEDRLPPGYIDRLADLVEAHLDLDGLLALCDIAQEARAEGQGANGVSAAPPSRGPAVRIGVARDEAFCFYYEANLELLQAFGAELVPFSALRDPIPEGIRGLYLGGGYPELYAERLSANESLREQVLAFAKRGGVIYGECGGLMYLSQGIELADGRRFPMCGVLPFWVRMTPTVKLGYTEVTTLPDATVFPAGETARGHLFHCSEPIGRSDWHACYEARTATTAAFPEGVRVGNTVASYVHLHFASNEVFPRALVQSCKGEP